jgi:HSP20 family protein
MALLYKRPVREFFDTTLQRTFDQFYNDFFNDFNPFEQLGKASYPKCNIINKNNVMIVQAAIPGLDKDDIELEVSDKERTITLRSTKSAVEDKHAKDDYISREIKFSSFTRSFAIKDPNLDLRSIEAKHSNGVLELNIPKKEKVTEMAEPRKIKIR